MQKPYLFAGLVVFILGFVFMVFLFVWKDAFYASSLVPSQILNFKDCEKAGYPVMESYPRQCRIPGGRNFVEEINPPLPPPPPPSAGGCVVTGCSGQVCAEEEVITTCEFRPEYACYRNAVCERQASGQCGWTPSAELTSCLNTTK